MHTVLQGYLDGVTLTGDLAVDAPLFISTNGRAKTAEHVVAVAAEARRLAALCGEDAERAAQAGLLHDVSVVIPSSERVVAAQAVGIDVLPEEAAFPMIVHQRLSVVFAREVFGVDDARVLSAIGCHTTLKANASMLDKLVFVADKIAWDQPGTPPYLDDLLRALDQSLDSATLLFLTYMWDRRESMRVVHPWFVDAYKELAGDGGDIVSGAAGSKPAAE